MESNMINGCQDYVADSNEAIEFKFVRRPADIENGEVFKPDMSHQVFGETETVFGYKNLKIKLYYTPGWLKTYFGVEYDSKIELKNVTVAVDDIPDIISRFLEHDFDENVDLFLNRLNDETKFRPFGEMIYSFSFENEGVQKTYEAYHISGECHDNKFFDYYKRLQTFIIWYIDCASFIDLDDTKWQFFILYEKYKSEEQGTDAFAVVGFATVYEYYAFPSNIRPRISQVLILPPYRRRGLAAYLINSIYKFYINNNSVVDITVEGASVEFQKVRDFVDLCRCESLECLSFDKLQNGYTKEMAKELQNRLKIHEKQARRIYEILLLRTVNRFDDNERRKYRLQIKRRINAQFERANKLIRKVCTDSKDGRVMQAAISAKEFRIEMLNKEYNDVEEQYYEIIERFLSRPLNL